MKRKNEQGWALLIELMIVALVSTILMSGAVVSYQRLQYVQQEQAARQQLRNVAQAESMIALCAMQSGCAPSVGVANLVPTVPTMNWLGYTFTFTNAACFQYTATPLNPAASQRAYYVDCSNVLHYVSAGSKVAPGPSSAVWQW